MARRMRIIKITARTQCGPISLLKSALILPKAQNATFFIVYLVLATII